MTISDSQNAEPTAQRPRSAHDDLQPSRWFWLLMFGTMIFVGGLAYLQYSRVDAARNQVGAPVGTLQVLAELPEFTLTNQHGEKVTRADLAGDVLIINFIFTECGGPCPLMTDRMREINRELVRQNVPRTRTVSFSVDPTTDTPKVLTEYAEFKQADVYDDWLFLTGDESTIYEICKAVFLPIEKGTDEHSIMHSPRFLLIDQKGRLRGYYEGVTDQEIEARFNGQIVDAPMNPDKMESLLKDVMTLLREETRRR